MITLDGLIKFIPNKMVPKVIFEVPDIKVVSKSNGGKLTRLGGMPIPQSFHHIKKQFIERNQ